MGLPGFAANGRSAKDARNILHGAARVAKKILLLALFVIDETAPIDDRAIAIATMTTSDVMMICASSPSRALRVAGVPLLVRAVVAATRAGIERIVVLTSDLEQTRALLDDARAAAANVEVVHRAALPSTRRVTVLAADTLVTAGALRAFWRAARDRPTIAVCDGPSPATVVIDDVAAPLDGLRSVGRVVTLDGEICRRVRTSSDVPAAEAALCTDLRAHSAATDGVLARTIDRRISCALSRWLVRHTRLRPNTITIIGTLIGLAGAAFLARGTYASGVVGTLLFLCAAIVDGCDGEVARLTFRESAFGQALDVTTDNVVHVAIFIGIAIAAHRRWPGEGAALAVLLLGGLAVAGAVSYYYLVVRTGWRRDLEDDVPAAARMRLRALRALEALMNRDFAYLLVVLAVADRLHWFLWGAAIGSWVFAALFVVIERAGAPTDDAVRA